MRSISSADTGASWVKSKRSRSGATSEPFWSACGPSTARSAACSRCVPEWLRTVAPRLAIDAQLRGIARTHAALCDAPAVHDEFAGRALRIAHLDASARRRDLAAVADLAAALGVEGRLLDHHLHFVALVGDRHGLAV